MNYGAVTDERLDPCTGLIAAEIVKLAKDRGLRFSRVERDLDLARGVGLDRRLHSGTGQVRFERATHRGARAWRRVRRASGRWARCRTRTGAWPREAHENARQDVRAGVLDRDGRSDDDRRDGLALVSAESESSFTAAIEEHRAGIRAVHDHRELCARGQINL